MTNLIEKMSPTHTFDWYLKWIATKLAGQEPIKYLAGKKKNDKPN